MAKAPITTLIHKNQLSVYGDSYSFLNLALWSLLITGVGGGFTDWGSSSCSDSVFLSSGCCSSATITGNEKCVESGRGVRAPAYWRDFVPNMVELEKQKVFA
eukprot:CAMPEP_0184661146 /NCGR_PEP_ID=MMETSP0308-20130426/37132_1 /TAXON_ID=38269 /ORGANISM="Gloeochaete witrockiana, Strain SAG 46.84" /LENGTH=101 /DNA_ID=CAMNT_0027102245 /DNA_START=314 /DNA_END=619 /DNA_ORIENTATION=+